MMRASVAVFIALLFYSQGMVFGQDFVVQSEKVFLPTEKAKIKVEQKGSRNYEMCVWKVKEPLKFFCMQEDFARPKIEGTPLREQLDAAIVKSSLAKPTHFNREATSTETIFEYLGMQKITVSASEKGEEREIEIGLPGKGVYLVELRSEVYTAQCIVAISEILMVEKQTSDGVLVFVANRKDGSPVQGATVSVYSREEKVVEGKTAQNGIVQLKCGYRPSFRIFATINGDFTANESFYYPVAVESVKCYLYTDRPVYRPGEKVYFKGIARLLKDGTYILPLQTRVSYAILDVNRKEVAKGEVEMTRFGTFSGEYTLPEECSLG
ncbi:MAG: MG2 domain-containing protein [Planctomycetota bacterium]|nr:MG2 domain-containing protein [Planctomycetota bacterium]